MRRTIILAAGFALAATAAFAQGSPRDRDDSDRGGWYEGRGDRGRDMSSRDMGSRDMGDWHGRMRRDDDDRGDRGDRASGSRFYLRNGDVQVRIVCGNREPARACVDAALMLMERASQSGTRSSPPAGTPQ
jgi:hypothetical protein